MDEIVVRYGRDDGSSDKTAYTAMCEYKGLLFAGNSHKSHADAEKHMYECIHKYNNK